MNKKLYILILFLIIFVGINKVNADDIDYNVGSAGLSGSPGCCDSYGNCAYRCGTVVSDLNWHDVIGARFTLYDNNNKKKAEGNFWNENIVSRANLFTVSNNEITFNVGVGRKNKIGDYIITGLTGNYLNTFDNMDYFNFVKSIDSNKVTLILSKIYKNYENDSNLLNYYFVVEPIFLHRQSYGYGNQNYYYASGTMREVYDLTKVKDTYNGGNGGNFYGFFAGTSGYNLYNFLNAIYVQNDDLSKGYLSAVNVSRTFTNYYNNYGNGNAIYGIGRAIVNVKDNPPNISPKPTLTIKKYKNDPTDGSADEYYDGSASFSIQKCISLNEDNHTCKSWGNDLFTFSKDTWVNKSYKISNKNNNKLVTGLYRIKETSSIPLGTKVFFKSGNNSPVEVNVKNDLNGSEYFEFNVINGSNTISAYNYSTTVECYQEVMNIFNSSNDASERRYYLKKLYDTTYNDYNNLVAFGEGSEFTPYINGDSAITETVAKNMCTSSSEDDDPNPSTPTLVCEGDMDIGTKVDNSEKFYPMTNFYKYFVSKENSYKMDVGSDEIDCAVTYKITNQKFSNDEIKTGRFLWQKAPGNLEATLTCYGFIQGNYNRKITIESGVVSGTFGDIDVPSLKMKVSTKNGENTRNIIASYTYSDKQVSCSNIDVDGNKYCELDFTITVANNVKMDYDKDHLIPEGDIKAQFKIVENVYNNSEDVPNVGGGFFIPYDEPVPDDTPNGNLSLYFGNKDIKNIPCEYNLKREFLETPPPGSPTPDPLDYNFEVRFIDTNNPFPGFDGSNTRNIGSNWSCASMYFGKDVKKQIIGDLNGDGSVDDDFRSAIISQNSLFDLNGSGDVSNEDYQIFFDKNDPICSAENKSDYLINRFIRGKLDNGDDDPQVLNSDSTSDPLYTFTLNSNDINVIRNYNDTHRYDRIVPDRDDKKLSQFITDALSADGMFGHNLVNGDYSCSDNRGKGAC